MPAYLWAALTAATLLLLPRSGAAQSCCGANSTTDFGVVAPHAWATLASSLSYAHGMGSYDAAGRFRGGHGLRDGVLRLGGGIRLPYEALQVHGNAAMLLQHRELGEVAETALGVGDVAVALRWTALKPERDGIDLDHPESLVPLWDLFVGVKLPLGAQPGADRDPSQADVFGNGAYELSLGTKVLKSLTDNHLVALRFQYDLRFSTERNVGMGESVDFNPGNQFGLRGEWIYTEGLFWSTGLFVGLRLAGAVSTNDIVLPDSDERLLNFGGQVTYAFDYPAWDVTFGVNSDAFWNQGGVNVPFAAVGAMVMLRRTFVGDGGHAGHHHAGHGIEGHHHP